MNSKPDSLIKKSLLVNIRLGRLERSNLVCVNTFYFDGLRLNYMETEFLYFHTNVFKIKLIYVTYFKGFCNRNLLIINYYPRRYVKDVNKTIIIYKIEFG